MQVKKLMNVIFLAGVVILGACEYATITPDVPSPTQTVSFSNDLIPFFQISCAGCHKSGGPAPDLTSANAYQSLVSNNMFVPNNAAGSILYQKVSTGSMVQYSNATSTQLVKNWINQGGKNN